MYLNFNHKMNRFKYCAVLFTVRCELTVRWQYLWRTIQFVSDICSFHQSNFGRTWAREHCLATVQPILQPRVRWPQCALFHLPTQCINITHNLYLYRPRDNSFFFLLLSSLASWTVLWTFCNIFCNTLKLQYVNCECVQGHTYILIQLKRAA